MILRAGGHAVVGAGVLEVADREGPRHLILQTGAAHTGTLGGTGGGVIFSLGGVHPYLRHVRCTSAPLVHTKSGCPTGMNGIVNRGVVLSSMIKLQRVS